MLGMRENGVLEISGRNAAPDRHLSKPTAEKADRVPCRGDPAIIQGGATCTGLPMPSNCH